MLFTQTVPSKTLTCTSLSGRNLNSNRLISISMATGRATTAVPSPPQRRRTMSALEARISLVAALASQASSVSQRRKCSNPSRTLQTFLNLLRPRYQFVFNIWPFKTCSFTRIGHGDCQIRLPQKLRGSYSRRSPHVRYCFK